MQHEGWYHSLAPQWCASSNTRAVTCLSCDAWNTKVVTARTKRDTLRNAIFVEIHTLTICLLSFIIRKDHGCCWDTASDWLGKWSFALICSPLSTTAALLIISAIGLVMKSSCVLVVKVLRKFRVFLSFTIHLMCWLLVDKLLNFPCKVGHQFLSKTIFCLVYKLCVADILVELDIVEFDAETCYRSFAGTLWPLRRRIAAFFSAMILWKGLSLIDSWTHLIQPSLSSSVAVDSR